MIIQTQPTTAETFFNSAWSTEYITTKIKTSSPFICIIPKIKTPIANLHVPSVARSIHEFTWIKTETGSSSSNRYRAYYCSHTTTAKHTEKCQRGENISSIHAINFKIKEKNTLSNTFIPQFHTLYETEMREQFHIWITASETNAILVCHCLFYFSWNLNKLLHYITHLQNI